MHKSTLEGVIADTIDAIDNPNEPLTLCASLPTSYFVPKTTELARRFFDLSNRPSRAQQKSLHQLPCDSVFDDGKRETTKRSEPRKIDSSSTRQRHKIEPGETSSAVAYPLSISSTSPTPSASCFSSALSHTDTTILTEENSDQGSTKASESIVTIRKHDLDTSHPPTKNSRNTIPTHLPKNKPVVASKDDQTFVLYKERCVDSLTFRPSYADPKKIDAVIARHEAAAKRNKKAQSKTKFLFFGKKNKTQSRAQ